MTLLYIENEWHRADVVAEMSHDDSDIRMVASFESLDLTSIDWYRVYQPIVLDSYGNLYQGQFISIDRPDDVGFSYSTGAFGSRWARHQSSERIRVRLELERL